MNNKLLFAACLSVAALGLLSPPLALAAGLAFALLFQHPFEAASRRWAKWLLQISVVALGFDMSFGQVWKTGRAGFVYTAIGISVAVVLGLTLGRVLSVRPKAAFLITVGTAICGGSAIAAIAPITQPDEEELAMSLGTVFTLNAVALFLFPAIGFALHLTQSQFGLWSALAIHDTTSVVGAAAKFGPHALEVGTVVKLTRALWIIPVAILTAVLRNKRITDHLPGTRKRAFLSWTAPWHAACALLSKRKLRVQFPWFILLFCLAAFIRTSFGSFAPLFAKVSHAGHLGLAVTLFLIGTGISRKTVKQAGLRVMAQGILLWAAVAVCSLLAIRAGWIHL